MTNTEIFYPESRFGGFTDIDGTIAFFCRVNSLLDPSYVVLDVGCGRGAYGEDRISIRRNLRILKGKVFKVIGIDVSPDARENPFIDEFHAIEGDQWPIESNSIDLLVCDHVVEHILDPEKFFDEVCRVLVDGGYLCIRTPNRWSYNSIAATIIPNKYHSRVIARVQVGRKGEDVFPTYYKCNSTRKMRGILKKHNIDCVVYGYEPEPSYLSFSKVAYFFGVMLQKISPGFVRPSIFAFGKIAKPPIGEDNTAPRNSE